KADSLLDLEHGQPLIFGKDRNRGIRLNGLTPAVVTVNGKDQVDDLLIHDEGADPLYAMLLSRLTGPDYPECIGVLRCVRRPTFEEQLAEQLAAVRGAKHPAALLEAALAG